MKTDDVSYLSGVPVPEPRCHGDACVVETDDDVGVHLRRYLNGCIQVSVSATATIHRHLRYVRACLGTLLIDSTMDTFRLSCL